MKRSILVLIGLLIFISGYTQDAIKNKSLPSVLLKDFDGKELDLKKYAENGKITIICTWATWCSPCIKELNNMSDLLDDWIEEYNLELVAISIDNSRNSMKVKPFVNGNGWEFDVLLDVNSDTKRALNYANTPFTILVDQQGKIVYRHTGYMEGDEYVLEDEIKKIASK